LVRARSKAGTKQVWLVEAVTVQLCALVAVSTTVLPAGMPVTVLPTTVPALAVTVALLVKVNEYVCPVVAQVVPVIVKVGSGLIVKVTAVRVRLVQTVEDWLRAKT
jgi:hypothetical protein